MATSTHTQPQTAVDLAVTEVERHQATLDRWEADRLANERELADLEAGVGLEVLDDETRADQLSDRMQQLRGRIAIAERASVAARVQVEDAQRAAVAVEAAQWVLVLTERLGLLSAHESVVEGLLRQLLEHDGVEYDARRSEPRDAFLDPGVPRTFAVSKTSVLRRAVEQARITAQTLRDLAAGVEPTADRLSAANVMDGTVQGLPASFYYGETAAIGQALERARRARVEQAHDEEQRAIQDRTKREAQRPVLERALDVAEKRTDLVMREYQRQDALSRG